MSAQELTANSQCATQPASLKCLQKRNKNKAAISINICAFTHPLQLHGNRDSRSLPASAAHRAAHKYCRWCRRRCRCCYCYWICKQQSQKKTQHSIKWALAGTRTHTRSPLADILISYLTHSICCC